MRAAFRYCSFLAVDIIMVITTEKEIRLLHVLRAINTEFIIYTCIEERKRQMRKRTDHLRKATSILGKSVSDITLYCSDQRQVFKTSRPLFAFFLLTYYMTSPNSKYHLYRLHSP